MTEVSSAYTPTPRVANRYGPPKPVKPARPFRLLVVTVLLASVAAVAVFALTSGNPRISSKDVGFSISGDQRASVDFELTKPADAAAECAIQVLSENYAVVGWKVVAIGPNAETDGVNNGRTTAHRAELRTDSPGVSGGVNACWLVAD
ncbi:DUF4307 domain-containing protein [Arthrobacter sp. H41]|uniref:DUF4307 domain-containing protein n=1 Tax=Arthrobacter sp. H41 TaxID=1312978 RepID=UPI00138AE23E|nr:DUF4307 domain-containing protein [Arthrobacter sp. H41]